MLKEFKNFIAKGNMLDMAVGIVTGAAFTALVNSLVADLITPILSFFTQGINFQDLTLSVGPITFAIGNFINALLSFLVIAFVLFTIVKAANKMKNEAPAEAPAPTKICPHCLSEIPEGATRCPHCTSELN